MIMRKQLTGLTLEKEGFIRLITDSDIKRKRLHPIIPKIIRAKVRLMLKMPLLFSKL
jgi:hypothetical protein